VERKLREVLTNKHLKMDTEGLLQMGLTAAAGIVLLYTISKGASTPKDQVKYDAPPVAVKKEQHAHHEEKAPEPVPRVMETPGKKLDERNQPNESAIMREMHMPPDTPSWMSQREPSFIREFPEEDLHPTWMSSKKESRSNGNKHDHENGHGNGHSNGNGIKVHDEFEPSWLSHREPSFEGNPFETEMQPSWMSSRPVEPTPVVSKLAMNGHSEVHHQTHHHPAPVTDKKLNQGFIEQEIMELSWVSSRDVQNQVYEAEFSWMTKKDPTPSLKQSITRIPSRPHRDHRVVVSTNDVVSHVARDHSDMVFVYPVAASGFLGETLKVEEKQHPNCKVQLVETRSGAGRVVVGSASSHRQRVSVLCSSRSLRPMVPAILELAEKGLAVTFHVALSSICDEDVSSKIDHTDLLVLKEIAHATILFSAGAQDIYENAVAAHVISHQLMAPVFHVFDSTGRLNRIADIELSLKGKDLTFHRHVDECNTKLTSRILRSIRKAPFEYSGAPNARVVIIAMGAAAQVAERHVISHAGSVVAVGVIRVRMLRPWSSEELLRAVPASALRVCVLDQSNTDALFADVAASFAAEATRRHVQVSYVHVPPSFRGVTFDLVTRAFEELMLSNDERLVLAVPVKHGHRKHGNNGESHHDDDHHAEKALCLFVSAKNAHSAFVAGKETVAHLGRDHVRFASYTDDFAGDNGGISLMELRFGSSHSESALDCPIEASQADVVVIGDENCLNAATSIDLFGPLKEGGIVILPSKATLSLQLKRRASSKHARLVHMSENAGPDGWATMACALGAASKRDLDHVMPYLLSAFRAAHHDSMDWNELNDACRRMERGVDALMSKISPSTNGEMNGNGSAQHHNAHENGHRSSSTHFPRRLGDLFQSDTNSFGNFGMDASQNGMSDISASSFPLSDATVFGLIPRMPFSKHGRDNHQTHGNGHNESSTLEVVRPHEIAWNVVFKDAYETGAALRPREHEAYKVRLVARKRLTPLTYERNIFHLEFDISGTDLKYEIGDALGVFGHNDVAEIDDFIAKYNETGGNIDPESFIAFKNAETHAGKAELVSVRNLLIQHLDLFGRPSKKFYLWLSHFAKSRYEQLKLSHTGTDDAEAFKLGVSETLTFADILLQHPSARPTVEELASVIPAIKARHYSIASSMRYTPRSVSLLIVAVDWKTPLGRVRYGQCTRYLANLDPDAEEGCFVTVDVVPSVLRLPPRPEQPIVMAGLGTGMAPFRAFVQERKVQKESGLKVGPIVLYFGARHRSEEWLYGEEWDQYFREGLVTHLGLAFSRDQKEKIYIQHRIKEDAELLKKLFLDQEGFFYLCGPTWPVPDVRDAMAMGLDPENAKQGNTEVVERLKDEGRYILEVY